MLSIYLPREIVILETGVNRSLEVVGGTFLSASSSSCRCLANSVDLSGRGTARAENAQGTPTQSHISPSMLVYEE